MIVKLRQNFTKMRELSRIRDQKKSMGKYWSFTRYDYVPKWEHWRFSTQTVETNSKFFIFDTKQSEQSTYRGSWYISHHIAAFDVCKRLLHFMHMIRVFFWHTLHLLWVVETRKCPSPSKYLAAKYVLI